MTEKTKTTIAPDTKLSQALEDYPELEPVIEEMIPDYQKLSTPALREVVARTLTLEQAANAAGISALEFVMKLRKTAGIDDPVADTALQNAPSWVQAGTIRETLDARPMLAQGQHPKALVEQQLLELSAGQMLHLLTPFVPGPLIELARGQGFQTWTKQTTPGKFETFFGK